MTRKDFLFASGAFLAAEGFTGCAAARAVGLAAGGVKLRFGVVSDVHLSSAGVRNAHCGDTTLLERAFAYFRDQGADAVMIAGDIADWGLVDQLVAAGEAWKRVFPGNRGKDGKPVEKLFVYGNHDHEGWQYGYETRYKVSHDFFTDEKKICTDFAAAWKLAFGEDYSEIWLKEVNGYKFIGCNLLQYPKNCRFLEEHRAELAGEKPFFYVQHYHLRGTTAAPYVWGQDGGYSTAALAKFPNAVAFSGHSHTPLADERVFWQGAFTSVGTASLRYLIPLGGRENAPLFGVDNPNVRQMAKLDDGLSQHGLLVSVYDDAITFERRDFTCGLPVGRDWVMPLPFDGSLSRERRAAAAEIPQFAAEAKAVVSSRRGKDSLGHELDQVVVTFPAAMTPVKAHDYEVTVEIEEVDTAKTGSVKRVYAPDFCRALAKNVAPVECVFAEKELPKPYREGWGEKRLQRWPNGVRYRFAVRPCNCWGAKGEAIYSDWKD